MPEQLSIAIINEQEILIDGIMSLLGTFQDIRVVVTSNDPAVVLQKRYINQIELIIMDTYYRDASGIDALAAIQRGGYSGKSLFLTSRTDVHVIHRGIRLGANGFITKASAHQELLKAIRYIMDGQTYLSQELKNVIITSFQDKINSDKPGNGEIDLIQALSKREIEILTLIANEMTSAEIAAQLCIAIGTVNTHRKNLLSKLQVRSSVGLALAAQKFGII